MLKKLNPEQRKVLEIHRIQMRVFKRTKSTDKGSNRRRFIYEHHKAEKDGTSKGQKASKAQNHAESYVSKTSNSSTSFVQAEHHISKAEFDKRRRIPPYKVKLEIKFEVSESEQVIQQIRDLNRGVCGVDTSGGADSFMHGGVGP